ncbi:hypothetical protein AAU61_14785 [Desulfocarbo indianensis]|nr:hypothetical protein AAU61_14785 [Desulfocarbo indianensis]
MAERIIGLIAGTSQFPLLFAKAARAKGYKVVAVAIEGETFPQLAGEVDEITWVKLGKLGKLLKAFHQAGVQRAVMAGGVKKTRMFKDVKPDLKALGLVSHLRHLADDGLLRTFAGYLAEQGIEIIASHELVPELLAREGQYTRRGPSRDERDDLELGWRLSAELGRLDIGQCLVLKGKVVIAVEALEGTDACIRRGGELAGPGVVVVKRCKTIQDLRFDLPSVGADTVAAMNSAGAACLCIEAGRTLVFDREAMVAAADQAGICILGRKGEAIS